MKLYSYVMLGDRLGETCLSDMSPMEFAMFAQTHWGRIAITMIMDVEQTDAQRWQAKGLPTRLKRNK